MTLRRLVEKHFDSLDVWRYLVSLMTIEEAFKIIRAARVNYTLAEWWTECRSK